MLKGLPGAYVENTTTVFKMQYAQFLGQTGAVDVGEGPVPVVVVIEAECLQRAQMRNRIQLSMRE